MFIIIYLFIIYMLKKLKNRIMELKFVLLLVVIIFSQSLLFAQENYLQLDQLMKCQW